MTLFRNKNITGRSLLYAALIAGISILGMACSSKGEQAAVEETADQIENAHIAGREAAREFVSRNWKDTLELQAHLVEAASKRAPYDSLPKCRATYDSAFISTVRTVRPEIAAQLEAARPK